MIDLKKAIQVFRTYVSSYDDSIPAIHLKIIHTFAVMKVSDELCDALHLSKEDKELAALIGLLHDIGRFEQWVRYQSYVDHKTIDHALFSSELLFEQGLIRQFIEDDQYDSIIQTAIEQHNKYQIDTDIDEHTLMFVNLIRDADKLDNFRVKEEEPLEAILGVSEEELVKEEITPVVYEQFYQQETIYSPNRKTHLDIWLSCIAFIFDLHYDVSLIYIKENNWVNRSFDRVQPTNEKTLKQYQVLKQRAIDYL